LTLQLLYIALKFINLKLIRTRTFHIPDMKRNIAIGIFLIGAMALSSCSTTKLANTESSDDVYFSKAKAGDDPTYAAADTYNQNVDQDQDYNDDDYFYYDDYASRINRFSYYSPFSYYDNLYYGYNNYAFNNGFSLGFNYGPYGYGYSPYGYGGWGLGLGYGYGGWGLGLGYGYGWGGLGWGYGGYYGGGYYGGGYYGGGYYAGGTPRPNRGVGYGRGSGSGTASTPGFGTRVPANSGIGYIPGGRGTNNNYNRPARTDARPSRSDNQPARAAEARQATQQQPTYTPAPSNNNSGGGTRSSSGGSSGGGGRPGRP
jgi:hypothetical protein